MGKEIIVLRPGEKLDLYLVALPSFHGEKGFNHPTVLVRARDEFDAASYARRLKGRSFVGDVKKQEE